MRIEELIIYGKKHLHSTAAKMLLSNLLSYDTLELLNHLDEEIDEKIVVKYKELISAVLNDKPLQYIIGNVNFHGYEFEVNENVLIPRFETEELVEETIRFIDDNFKNPKIIDLGCGSGVIGITIKKKRDNCDITCLDISKEALEVAKKNSKKLKADVKIIEGDMLSNIKDKFDIIISNPPYVSYNEEIEPIVKDNEPEIALFAENNGLYFYEKILKDCSKNLNDKFLIAFEIGMNQKDEITKLAHKYLNNIEVVCKRDLSDRDRMLFIYKNID